MGGSDGSIRINTELDTKNVNVQMASLQNRMVKTADKINSLRSKMDAMKDMQMPTQEYVELQKYIEATEGKLLSLYDKQERFLETGGKKNSTAYRRMIYDAEQLETKLKMAEADMQGLVDTGKAFTPRSNTEEYAKMGQQLQYLENDMDVMAQKEEILRNKAGDIEQPLAALKARGKGLVTVFGKLGSVVKNTAVRAFKSLGSIAKSALSKLMKPAQKSKELFSSMSAGIKKLLPAMLVFNMIRKAFRSLVSGMKEGFSNLYNAGGGFKSSVDGLKASMLTLKNSFAAAFSPLIETVIPYIQLAVDYITRLMDAVGQFMAAITGQKSYTKAIKQTTAALEDESKASNKQLSSLDKLNNMSSGGSGSGAGSGAGAFEEEAVSDKYKDLAQQLKDMWANSNFYGLGSAIGERLKKGLDSIPWNTLKDKAKKIGNSITSLINGFVEVKGLGNSIGRTLAEAVNTGFTFLNTVVHGLHWDSIGRFIADTVNGFFEIIDWNSIYDALVTGARGLANLINSFVSTFHWENISNTISNIVNIIASTIYTLFSTVNFGEIGKNLGEQLMSSIEKIDWQEVGRAIGSVIQAGLDFVIEFVKTLDLLKVAKAVIDTLKGFFEEVDMKDFALVVGSVIAAGIVLHIGASAFTSAATAIGSSISSALTSYALPSILASVGGWKLGNQLGRVIFGDEAYDDFTWSGFFDALNWEDFCGAVHEVNEELREFFGMPYDTEYNHLSEMAEKTRENVLETADTFAQGAVFIIEQTGLVDSAMDQTAQQAESDSERVSDSWQLAGETMASSSENFANRTQLYFTNTYDSVLAKTRTFIDALKKQLKNMPTVSAGSVLGGAAATIPRSYSSPAIMSLSAEEIPGYATGQVIPRTMKKHLAYLGDNNQETEVVSPLSTIKQAMREEIGNLGFGSGGQEVNLNLTVECEGYQLLRVIQKLDKEYFKQTGKHALA